MSRFTDTEISQYISNISGRMSNASSSMGQFNQSVQDVYANWLGYLNAESNESLEAESRVDFAAKARTLVDNNKAGLAIALDIIAGGMMDADGNPLTRADLLAEIAAIPVQG
jgi:hypothetical protein